MEMLIECLIFTKLYIDNHLDNETLQLHNKVYLMNVQYSMKNHKMFCDHMISSFSGNGVI